MLKFCLTFSDNNSANKLKLLNQTAPSYVHAGVVSHCNNIGVNQGRNIQSNHGNRNGDHNNAIDHDKSLGLESSTSRDNFCHKGLNFSSVFRLNITVSFPILE